MMDSERNIHGKTYMNFLPCKLTKNSIYLLAFIFVAAFFIRVQFVRLTVDNLYIERDAKEYTLYAHNLFKHGIFSKAISEEKLQPDSFRSPGYPLFIALIMAAGGEQRYLPVLIYTQAILSALLVPLTFFTGIYFIPASVALVAAVLVALSPHLITITANVLTETLFAFLLLAAICCFQSALANKHKVLFIISAVFFGCAYLTNEASLFMPYGLSVVIYVLKFFDQKSFIKNGYFLKLVLFLLIFSFVPAAWFLRNHFNLSADAKRGSDRAIATMSHGAYPNFIYKSLRYKRFPYREDPMQPAFGASFENFIEIFWARVKNEPYRYSKWYLVGKPYYFWSWDIIQGVGDVYIYPVKTSLFESSKAAKLTKVTMRFLHPIVLLLAFACIAFFFQNYRLQKTGDTLHSTALLPLAVCVYFTGIYMFFAPWPRYSIPLRPELYLCAVWSGTAITKLFLNRWRRRNAQ